MQKYKFTCLHVELKATTLQCDQIQTRPCFAWSCFLCCQPSHTPNLSCRELSSCWLWWWWQWSPNFEASAGCCSSLWAVPLQAAKVSLSSSPTSGLQALKDKEVWKQASLRSMLLQRRDLGITKIIHEHNITEAVHGEKRHQVFPPPAI